MSVSERRLWYLVRESNGDVIAGGYRSRAAAEDARDDGGIEDELGVSLVTVELQCTEARARVDVQSRVAAHGGVEQ